MDHVDVDAKSVALGPNGRELFVGTGDGRVLVRHGKRTRCLLQLGLPSDVRTIAFSRDSRSVAGLGRSGQIACVDVDSGEVWRSRSRCTGLAPGRSGGELIGRDPNGRLEVLDAANGHRVDQFRSVDDLAPNLATRSACRQIFGSWPSHDTDWSVQGCCALAIGYGIGGDGGEFRLEDSEGTLLYHEDEDRAGWYRAVSFSPSGDRVVLSRQQGGNGYRSGLSALVRSLEVETLESATVEDLTVTWIRHLDEQRILVRVVEDMKSRLELWDAKTLASAGVVHAEDFDHIALSPDRRRIAVSNGGRVSVFAIEGP